MLFFSRNKRHFRGRITEIKKDGKKEKKLHPRYIVGESKTDYYDFGITHDKKKGKGHNNHKLLVNPNPKDEKTAYLRKHLDHGNKGAYTKSKFNFSMSPKDDDYVDSLIKKYKKRRNNK